MKKGDVVQRVLFYGEEGGASSVWYGIVTYIHENGNVDVITKRYGHIYSGLWQKNEYIRTGDAFDLTGLEKFFRGWGD